MTELHKCTMCSCPEDIVELHKTNKGLFCCCCIESSRPYEVYADFRVTDQNSVYYVEEMF